MLIKSSPNISNKQNIFIEGELGIGKSSLLLEISSEVKLNYSGFMSLRMIDDNNNSMGFYLEDFTKVHSSIIHISSPQILQDRILMSGNKTNRKIHLQAFEEIFPLFKNVDNVQCFVLDEIGGIELQSEELFQHILAILQSNIPCIGTIKSKENFLLMKNTISHNFEEIENRRNKLKQYIEVVNLNANNKNIVKDLIKSRLNRSN